MKIITKIIAALVISSATVVQAGLISIGISPAGSDSAVGLSPANVVPAVTNSIGSGGTISGGIVYDTATSILQLTVGYGSAAGFTDLTGPAIGITLHGPAITNQNAAGLIDLTPFNFPAANPAAGGIVFGSITVASNAVADLLNGLDYINIATSNNPNGELRGQLIPLSPVIGCLDSAEIECGTLYTGTVTVRDPSGLAMSVFWFLNGLPVQTNIIAAGSSTATYAVIFNAELPLGTNQIEVIVTDSANQSASCSAMVIVVDTTPPIITAASASPNSLWPPNHKLVKVMISATVTDNCSATSWQIISVQSSEATNIIGSGNTSPDWKILNDHSVGLLSERSGTGSGRTYSITIQAKDVAGNLSAPKIVTVTTAKSQGKSR